MTESEWLSCTDPDAMLTHLGRATRWPWRLFRARRLVVSSRKLRLFACACCRDWSNLPPDPLPPDTIEAAERFADGEATEEELRAAQKRAPSTPSPTLPFFCQHTAVAVKDAWTAALVEPWLAAGNRFALLEEPSPLASDWKSQCRHAADLLRDIFGNPFPPPPAIDPAWLAYNNGTVKQLAQAAYEERELPSGHLDRHRLAVLADALEEAGCQDAELLAHLRSPGPHVRGCFAVDLLLNKE